MLTGLLFGQDTTIVLENGRTLKGTIVSETDSTYRIMGESWRVTDGVYEVFNTFINISKNETVKQDGLILKSGESYKGRYVKKVDELIVFQVEGKNHFTPFPILDVETIVTKSGEFTYPFDIPTKQEEDVSRILGYRPKSKIGQAIYGRFVLGMGVSLLALALGLPHPGM